MNAIYKINQALDENEENSYGNLIVLHPKIDDNDYKEPQYKLDSNGSDEDDIDEKEGKIPVQPLIGEEIERAKQWLLNRPERYKGNTLKNYTLFCFGVSVGLRISDLLSLKIAHVVKGGKIRDSMIIIEGKTKKKREIFFRPNIKKILADYINSIDDWKYNYYLFYPRNNYYTPMGRHNVNKLMKDIQQGLNLNFPIACHSLRKTFSRAVFDLLTSRGDIMALEKLQDILGHKDISTTRRYIGLQREGNRDIYLDEDLCI